MLNSILDNIVSSDQKAKEQAKKRWDNLAKPLNGMGILEDYIIRLAGISKDLTFDKKCVAVACADNGIVEEGVTQTGSEVTAIVAANMACGKATVSIMAKVARADVKVYDVGMLTTVDGVISKKIANGTKNFAKEKAMTKEQATDLIEKGIEIVKELKEEGYQIIATSEMGIGNTTTSSAIAAVLLDRDAKQVTGKGAGLDSKGIQHKANIIQEAIERLQPDNTDMIDIISKVGGFDIATLCGIFIGGAYYKVPIIIDGLISSVAALLAVGLNKHVKDYMLASHLSAEPAGSIILEKLGFKPLLICQMALGEGTGAIAIMPLLDMALAVYKELPTFQDVDIEEYVPLC